ncbi:hypothetical protein ACJX0J_011470 [Zea mays]
MTVDQIHYKNIYLYVLTCLIRIHMHELLPPDHNRGFAYFSISTMGLIPHFPCFCMEDIFYILKNVQALKLKIITVTISLTLFLLFTFHATDKNVSSSQEQIDRTSTSSNFTGRGNNYILQFSIDKHFITYILDNNKTLELNLLKNENKRKDTTGQNFVCLFLQIEINKEGTILSVEVIFFKKVVNKR